MPGIYKITCLADNRVYIGQATSLKERMANHRCRLKGNYHDNVHMQRAWNKYGEENFTFEIIDECEETLLDEKERYWISFYGYPDRKKVFNNESGGHCLKHLSEETKDKIRKSRLGPLNPSYGKIYSLEERKRISESMKKAIKSPNSKKAILESNLKRQRPVLQYSQDGTFICRYDGIQTAARKLGLQASLIHKVCDNQRKKTGGFVWRYENDTVSEQTEGAII